MSQKKQVGLLPRIIHQGGVTWQILGAGTGAFLGLLILLLAFQFFADLNRLNSGKGGAEDQFVIINKQVTLFNTLGEKAAFTEGERDSLLDQPFVRDVGVFSSNQYRVSASSNMLGFYTELFFESLPLKFVDVPEKEDFSWSEGQMQLPIILSRDYLALYNFGFAPSQGLPQFTPETIKRVSIDITLRGNGRRKTLRGKIIGFSDRVNSILVPQPFMEWANQSFGEQKREGTSRLILEVDNPYSKELRDFLEAQEYELSSGRLIGGQAGTLLRLFAGLLAFIGLIMMVLSVLVFLLIFQLTISKASGQIQLLLQLGYTPQQISQVLIRRFFRLFGLVSLAALLVFMLIRVGLVQWFAAQGFQLNTFPNIWVIFGGLLFIGIIGYLNVRSIKLNVWKLY